MQEVKKHEKETIQSAYGHIILKHLKPAIWGQISARKALNFILAMKILK